MCCFVVSLFCPFVVLSFGWVSLFFDGAKVGSFFEVCCAIEEKKCAIREYPVFCIVCTGLFTDCTKKVD